MHEVSMVSELVAECERRAGNRPVEGVRVRVAATVSEDSLRLAFDAFTREGPLSGADLEMETFAVTLQCKCGFSGSLGHDDVVGHMIVCPSCGDISASGGHAELELLEVRSG
jgi:Zn finger protein HypA/HybF involved in hydrogenase expression